ncbi:Neurofilament medium polypeptide [Frankliniella fusca]|uniref:Neurofilament medium polypeptide n=1 Tax=Frankliniella fusca TaxID=407009 RepID=A0AAE1L532_9NEOP|nr:Neurofilament medium polypeptide [Frankliniella fusca]
MKSVPTMKTNQTIKSGPQNINMDAEYIAKLLVELEQNKKIIKQLKEEGERKDRILQDLAVDMFCLAYVKPSRTMHLSSG